MRTADRQYGKMLLLTLTLGINPNTNPTLRWSAGPQSAFYPRPNRDPNRTSIKHDNGYTDERPNNFHGYMDDRPNNFQRYTDEWPKSLIGCSHGSRCVVVL